MTSFIIWEDKQGRIRGYTDAFLVKGAMDLECPQCHRRNEPVLFWYDGIHGCVSRRYFYCCPKCKIHYINWGSDADWKPGRLRIKKICKQNGDHRSERLEYQKTMRSFWNRLNNNVRTQNAEDTSAKSIEQRKGRTFPKTHDKQQQKPTTEGKSK